MQILKVAQFHDVVNIWSTVPAPFLDFETNGKDSYEPGFRVVCLSLTGYNREAQVLETIQIPLGHQTGENAEVGMVDAIATFLKKVPVGAFWVQAEAMDALAGFSVMPNFVDDPYIALRLYQDPIANLKDAVEKFIGVKMTRIEDVLEAGTYDYSTLDAQDPAAILYSEQDSREGFQLTRFFEQKLFKSKMHAVYQLEVAAAAILAEQTHLGYEMDTDVLERELDSEEVALSNLESDIFQKLGCLPFKLNSGPKLGAALANVGIYSDTTTKGGKDSWAMPVMEAMVRYGRLTKEQEEILNLIMDWKSRFSTRNSLRKTPTRLAADGRIHPLWKSIGFDGTARAYAENPSITSLPQGARRAMRAPKGKRWVKFDWKQAELRALAAASGDAALTALLNSGEDVHKGVFAKMKRIPVSDVTAENRETSKVISYSILYSGGSAYHVARSLGIEMGEAQALVDDYMRQFPQLGTFLDEIREKAIKTHYVSTFMNRKRRLSGDDNHRANQACDAMGQQSIGTALKIALKKMVDYHRMGHPCMQGLCQIIPVFDAIFYCVDASIPMDSHISVMKDLVQLNMAGVVLEAEFKMGPTWGDLRDCDSEEFVNVQAELDAQNVPRETLPEKELGPREALLKGLGLDA